MILGGSFAELPPGNCTAPMAVKKEVPMILTVLVRFKEIVVQGRDFPWPRPDRCPRCGSDRLWGHGFVRAIFDDCHDHVLLKRFRCPDCRCVVRLKPDGYFERFQASVSTIRSRIAYRVKHGTWMGGMSRSRQWYWLRNLTRRSVALKGLSWNSRLLELFDDLINKGEIPVSRLR